MSAALDQLVDRARPHAGAGVAALIAREQAERLDRVVVSLAPVPLARQIDVAATRRDRLIVIVDRFPPGVLRERAFREAAVMSAIIQSLESLK